MMKAEADKSESSRSKAAANERPATKSQVAFADQRPQAVAQAKLAQSADSGIGPLAAKIVQLQAFADASFVEPVQRVEAEEEVASLKGKFETLQRAEAEDEFQAKGAVAQNKEAQAVNNTGLPDRLKSGVEGLSGLSLDDVKVHYNSPKPTQLQAHAFAQGSEIHVAPGQEQHLSHEAWHVVQQKQGRVKPTKQMKGRVNDDAGLEEEADVMGGRALQLKETSANTLVKGNLSPSNLAQRKFAPEVKIATSDHLDSQYSAEMKGLKFSEKRIIFEKLNSAEQVYTADQIAGAILAAKSDLQSDKKEDESASQPAQEEANKQEHKDEQKEGVIEEGPARNPNTVSGYASMARVERPQWEKIEPQIRSGVYGQFEEGEIARLKATVEKTPDAVGVVDIIGRTFNRRLPADIAKPVKDSLTGAAPDLAGWRASGAKTITTGRADTRTPHVIKDSGGFYGWDAGIVAGPHARQMVLEMMTWDSKDQLAWSNRWKRPGPEKQEAQPWIAVGSGSGQKGGGAYFFQLPLVVTMHENSPMALMKDTGDIATANVIGVQLEGGPEIIMLTGVPWKYVTEVEGSIDGASVAKLDKEKAARATRKSKQTGW